MIVELTQEQILILSFALGLYADKVYEQSIAIPANTKKNDKSKKDIKEIMDIFNWIMEYESKPHNRNAGGGYAGHTIKGG